MTLSTLRRKLLLQYLLTVGLLLAVAEGALYGLWRWDGQHKLDLVLRYEVERLSRAVELEPDRPEIKAQSVFLHPAQLDGQPIAWQILAEDGIEVGRSKQDPSYAEDLPAVGGDDLPVDELRLQNVRYGDSDAVRAARLRVVRHRLEKAKRRIRMPESMTFDIRAVLDRAPLDEQLRRLAWLLGGGFPVVLGLAGLGGVYLIRKAVHPVELAFDRERRFTGAASHELRTPLTALRGEIDVTLRRQRNTEEYIASLRRMDALVARMTGLVEGLLLLARADAGHLLLGAGNVSSAALREALEHTLQLLPGRERVGVVGMANDDVAFPGDLLLLTLAVRNLLENALFHAPGAAVQVEFSTAVPGEIRVRIEDCGPGLPARVLHDLTAAESDPRRLARADGSACFGLAIAQAVVQAHGGRLSLKNRSGGGCVAEIVVPAVGASSPSTEEAIS